MCDINSFFLSSKVYLYMCPSDYSVVGVGLCTFKVRCRYVCWTEEKGWAEEADQGEGDGQVRFYPR